MGLYPIANSHYHFKNDHYDDHLVFPMMLITNVKLCLPAQRKRWYYFIIADSLIK